MPPACPLTQTAWRNAEKADSLKRISYTPVVEKDGKLVAEWDDGVTWVLAADLVGLQEGTQDKHDAIILESEYDEQYTASLTWVRKKIKDKKTGNEIGQDEWLTLFKVPKIKSKDAKKKQVVQLRNFKDRSEAESFMKVQFDLFTSHKVTKDQIEDSKKVWLQTWGNAPKAKAKAKAKATQQAALKRPSAEAMGRFSGVGFRLCEPSLFGWRCAGS